MRIYVFSGTVKEMNILYKPSQKSPDSLYAVCKATDSNGWRRSSGGIPCGRPDNFESDK
jgi:hypothetical protein